MGNFILYDSTGAIKQTGGSGAPNVSSATGTLAVAHGGTGDTTASGARTNLGLVIGTDVEAHDADLTALAGVSSNGLLARTGAGTASARTITAGVGISVSNGDGVSGNPTITLVPPLSVCEGRLTLTAGTPVTTSNVTGATTIYFTPYKGKYISLYDGSSAWNARSFAETSLALGTLTSGLPYDVFGYDNSGTLALESLAWTSGTARATALTLQDGVLVKTGATTRRYLGTFYTTSTTATEDSLTKRFVWNYYNRCLRRFARTETADNWNYTTATVRQANANTANKVEMVIGYAEDIVHLRNTISGTNNSTTQTVNIASGIGIDTTTAFTESVLVAPGNIGFGGFIFSMTAEIDEILAVGYHYASWNEWSTAAGLTTWYRSSIVGLGTENGLSGFINA